MNKKGFILVELLGVIIIISAILAIVFPSVSSVLNNGENTVINVQIKKILNGAYDYSINKISLLPDGDEVTYLTLNELKMLGYVDSNIIDPRTNEIFPNDMVISIKNVGSNYKNTNKQSILNGDYLYKIEDSLDSSDEKPIIEIIGLSEELVVVDIGQTYEEPKYTATDSNGKDITNIVIKNITKDNYNVNRIDAYEAGIYKIDYCVVDEFGNSSCKTLSIVIKDTTQPILSIPTGTTLSTSVTSYDLMDGVNCTDNSAKCEIDVNGNINFGTIGKYIIEYRASDPTGNTVIQKRVITIE